MRRPSTFAERDRAVLRAAVGADDHDELLVLVGSDRAFVHHHQRLLSGLPHSQPRELARNQPAVVVAESGAHADRAALPVDLIIDELDVALDDGA